MKISTKRQCTYSKSSKTLDTRHKEQIEIFEDNKQTIDLLLTKFHEVNKKLEFLKSKEKKYMTDKELSDIVVLTDNYNKLKEDIDNINVNTNEIVYYTNTSDILFDYYSLLEQKEINTLKTIDFIEKEPNTISIIDFFKKEHTSEIKDINNNTSSNGSTTSNDDIYTSNVDDEITKISNPNNRALLLDKYLSYTDKNYINNDIQNKDAEKCMHCKSINKIYCVNDSLLYCKDCYTVEKILTDNEKPSYKDPPKEISYFSYKRINHYTELFSKYLTKLLRTVGCS